MISFFKRSKLLYLTFFCFVILNISKVLGSDFLFERSIHEALKNSLELKVQMRRYILRQLAGLGF